MPERQVQVIFHKQHEEAGAEQGGGAPGQGGVGGGGCGWKREWEGRRGFLTSMLDDVALSVLKGRQRR